MNAQNPAQMKRCGVMIVFIASMAVAPDLHAQTRFPANGSTAVNPDLQLRLTFGGAPIIGKSGFIRVFDTADGKLVDEINMSLPPGPTERATGAALNAPYISSPYPYAELPAGRTNANTRAGTPTAGAEPPPSGYQLSIIGGFTDGFHFYPVIVDGNTAIIQLHHNRLAYGKTYSVEIDAEVFPSPASRFAGISRNWRFRTKGATDAPAPDATNLVVSGDGSGDFNTIQGAMDFIPDHGTKRVTVLVRSGVYHEIVYFRNKDNVTIQGEAPGAVRVTYANDETFNPHPVNLKTNELPGTYPSRRATFAVDNSTGIHLVNLILETTVYGQAEGLLITGNRNILSHVHVIGSGDALQVNGPTYIVDSEITGAGDTVLGRGPAFFERCTLRSTGVFMWIRNTDANHGNVFKDCTFIVTGQQPTTLARSPKNNASTYPYAEAVLLNCALSGVAPEGWGPADQSGNVHFWEFRSRNADGTAADVRQRVAWSRQLDPVKDAELIRNYSDPTFVLGGWTPEL
jgi:pectin methylesterase-like acyl-CoA thioesterase